MVLWVAKNMIIVTIHDQIGASPSLLNFKCKLFVRKHVHKIVIPTIVPAGKSGLGFDEEMLNIVPLSRPVTSSILKELIHEADAL